MKKDKLFCIIMGASGDLARRKIFPALFSLYCQGFLPDDCGIVGFARTDQSVDSFRNFIKEKLTCRYSPPSDCSRQMEEFIAKCHYYRGEYASADSMLGLYQFIKSLCGDSPYNKIFYMAVPPEVFKDISFSLGNAGLISCRRAEPWTRVVIEKPFGYDRRSSDILADELLKVFTDDQIYRIDHYLGKEMIQNLLVLRFANIIFEPLWSRKYVQRIHIQWEENLSVAGRGGYFDKTGIIRDVIQNHLMQICALTTMEPPRNMTASVVAREKVRILRSIIPPSLNDCMLGQYRDGVLGGRTFAAYRGEQGVRADSIVPTFAAIFLRINNKRWQDVPIFVSAGKGLSASKTEIRIVFKSIDKNIFCNSQGCPLQNELVVRVQPDEAIYYKITSKVPGLAIELGDALIDLKYHEAYKKIIPDAYERLLLDVILGDKTLFIGNDELGAAWDIFTPLLHEIDAKRPVPEFYPFGVDSAVLMKAFFGKYGIKN